MECKLYHQPDAPDFPKIFEQVTMGETLDFTKASRLVMALEVPAVPTLLLKGVAASTYQKERQASCPPASIRLGWYLHLNVVLEAHELWRLRNAGLQSTLKGQRDSQWMGHRETTA